MCNVAEAEPNRRPVEITLHIAHCTSHIGFTLVEMLAVLILMALLSTLAVVSLTGVRSAADMKTVCAQIEQFDRMSRDRAVRRNLPLRVEVDIADGSWSRWNVRTQEQIGTAVRLAGKGVIDGVLIAGQQQMWTDRANIAYTSEGNSPTYAVRLKAKGQETWLLFAGLSGQVAAMRTPEQVRTLFDVIEQP